MIRGKIKDGLYPEIEIELVGSIGSQKFSVLVDTGFNGDFALHRSWAPRLGLETTGFTMIDYADGERLREPVSSARVLWHGKWQEIEVVLSNDEEPAIGTRLLQGNVVTMNFMKNILTIKPPSRSR